VTEQTGQAATNPTERLYYDDPWLRRFEARVIEVKRVGNRTAVILDRSAFYPESGGQLADRGTLGSAPVNDVQLEGQRVLHFLGDGTEPPAVGDQVQANIDAERRRSHMALHTGQHILSRALLDMGNHDTVSSRLGETQCTIDLDTDRIDEAGVAAAEARASAIIDDDIPVETVFPEASELEKLPLRKAPPDEARIRVVRIGDFDVTPCGGTHCTRTAQVGLVRIVAIERHKRQVRLQFVAGPRARSTLGAHDRLLRELARQFSCSPDLVGTGVDKLRSELTDSRAQAKALGSVAADLLVAALSTADGPVIFAIDGPATVMRDVARRICQQPDAVCLLAAHTTDATQVIVARGEHASFDCGAFMKRVATSTGGRGGGRPDRAEGKLPPGMDWPSVARSNLDHDS
jgi:alanyl-tRNA synthetase